MTDSVIEQGIPAPVADASPGDAVLQSAVSGLDAAATTLADRMRVLLRDGRVNVAKLLVPALLRMAGGAPEARLLAAEVALAAGDPVSALREAADAVVMTPTGNPAKVILGRALLALDRREEAASCLTEAWQGGADDEATLLALAEASPAAALAPLFAALAEAPQSAKFYRVTVRALLDLEEISAAGKVCDIAVAAGVSDPSIRLLALEASGRSGDWQKALTICEAMESASPGADA